MLKYVYQFENFSVKSLNIHQHNTKIPIWHCADSPGKSILSHDFNQFDKLPTLDSTRLTTDVSRTVEIFSNTFRTWKRKKENKGKTFFKIYKFVQNVASESTKIWHFPSFLRPCFSRPIDSFHLLPPKSLRVTRKHSLKPFPWFRLKSMQRIPIKIQIKSSNIIYFLYFIA